MSGAWVCDGPGCDTWERGPEWPGWLLVEAAGGNLHFCGWECCIRYGAHQTPPITIEVESP